MSKREQILSALFERLKSLDITIKAIPKNGILILRDGKQGDPEVILSPPMCIFHHEAELEVIVQDAKSEVRDKKLDEILVKVGTLLCCEDKLNGLTDYIYPKQPEILEEYIEGAPNIKAAIIPIILEYTTTSALL